MRILLISDITGWDMGGVPVEMALLAGLLQDAGHTVAVLTDVSPLRGLTCKHYPLRLVGGHHLVPDIQYAVTDFAPDVVHFVALGVSRLVRLRNHLGAFPWVLTLHNVPPSEKRLGGLYASRRLHYAFRDTIYFGNRMAWKLMMPRSPVPLTIVHSELVRDAAISLGYPQDRIHLIPLTTNFERWNSGSPHGLERCEPIRSGIRLCTVGGIVFTKGHHDGVQAVHELRKSGLDLRYDIIGRSRDSQYVSWLRKQISSLGLDDVVTVHLQAGEEVKRQILGKAHAYLQLSHEEGFCISFLEASGEVPRLVGTRTGAIPMIADGDPLMRVAPVGDPAAAASHLSHLLGLRVDRSVLDERAERITARFGSAKYVASHMDLYDIALREWSAKGRDGTAGVGSVVGDV